MATSCTPRGKKSAKMVRGLDGKMHCVRYGDRHMTIKKHIPARKKSLCARHRCHLKRDPATAGYQSCLAWSCNMSRRKSHRRARARKSRKSRARQTRRRTRRRSKGGKKRSRRRSTRQIRRKRTHTRRRSR